jgi:hypothetical protein
MQCIFIETPPLDVYAQMAADEILITQKAAQNICAKRRLSRVFGARGKF